VADLNENGYAVIENVLSQAEVTELRQAVDARMEQERADPFDPEDGSSDPQDAALESYMAESYNVSKAELGRLLRRIQHTRAQNENTPWPVDPAEVNKAFLHLPTLFDQDVSQRIWHLLTKGEAFPPLVEHPTALEVIRRILGPDCVLSDCSATSIGAHTDGGAWHVDVPLGQLPEPLPDFPLTTQNVWMLDDFTEENGATRVVKGSHKTRKKPRWEEGEIPEETILTAPAGSLAIWLSNTWHRSGPNFTDNPRRAILCYYCRSWVKPFADMRATVSPELLEQCSPTVRYLMGFSANCPVRG
jgi:ectoine hydroxylase-related dioxygenase (phytanoyl-CoA dioxygenase family)